MATPNLRTAYLDAVPEIAARNAVPAVRSPGVYALLKGDVVQYVGMSANPVRRVGGHVRRGVIDFDRYWIHACPSVEEARAMEERLIQRLDPPCNVQHKPTPAPERYGAVVSTRYDPKLVEWMQQKLRVSKAELVKRALDDLMAKVIREDG